MEEEEEESGKKQKMEEPEKKTEETHSESKEEERCETKSSELQRQTSYYCKTCSDEPSLCPVPCFELYHTKLIYRTAPELESQGELLFVSINFNDDMTC